MANTVKIDKFHFRKRIKSQYNLPYQAIVREIMQNSSDAKASKIEFSFHDGEYSASDDGKGMTQEELLNYFLTLGGSKKESGSVGGFGAAKELLAFAWQSWQLKTETCTIIGSGNEYENPLNVGHGHKGFTISASDEYFSARRMEDSVNFIYGMSSITPKVYVNGQEATKGRSLRKSQIVKTFEFGTLYVYKGNDLKYHERQGQIVLRTNGLYTGCVWVTSPYIFYLDITSNSTEVLTESRDNLRYNASQEVMTFVTALNPEQIEEKPKAVITKFGSKTEKATLVINGREDSHKFDDNKTEYGQHREDDESMEDFDNPTIETIDLDSLTNDQTVESLASQFIPGNSQSRSTVRLTGSMESIETFNRIMEENHVESHVTFGNVTTQKAVSAPESDNKEDSQEPVIIKTDEKEFSFQEENCQPWRKDFYFCDDSGKYSPLGSDKKTVKRNLAKALEILNVALNMFNLAYGSDFQPGLYHSDSANGLHFKALDDNGQEIDVIAIKPETLLTESPFCVLELVIHEAAHKRFGAHGQDYEYHRMGIASAIGKSAMSIITTIAKVQSEPMLNGRYWED